MAKLNRTMNDLAETQFKTPPELTFIRYGRRGEASYKVSKHPETDKHLIEVVLKGEYSTKWVNGWDGADSALRTMSTKFKAKGATDETQGK